MGWGKTNENDLMIDSTYRLSGLSNLEYYGHFGWYFKKGSSLFDDFSKTIREQFKKGTKQGYLKMSRPRGHVSTSRY